MKLVPQRGPTLVEGCSHVEFYTANSLQAADFYRNALGFDIVGSSWPDAACTDRYSVVVQRGEIRLILTEPRTNEGCIAEFVDRHGDGARDIALSVTDVDRVFELAVGHGAIALEKPATQFTIQGPLRTARIEACGDLVHSLIDTSAYGGALPPGFAPRPPSGPVRDTALESIDHMAIALHPGDLGKYVEFYTSALGFLEAHQEQVRTKYSAMSSKVVETPSRTVRFPMMEPAPGKLRSQIEAYLTANQGPGVQHVALRSSDIVKSVSALRAAGVEFLEPLKTNYEALGAHVRNLCSDLDQLKQLGILIDQDATGCLLQVFTKPIGPRPTLFLEIIERRGGAEGFGSGNIKSLFEAVERHRMGASEG